MYGRSYMAALHNTRRLTCEIGTLTLVAWWTWATFLREDRTLCLWRKLHSRTLAWNVLSRKDRRQAIYTKTRSPCQSQRKEVSPPQRRNEISPDRSARPEGA